MAPAHSTPHARSAVREDSMTTEKRFRAALMAVLATLLGALQSDRIASLAAAPPVTGAADPLPSWNDTASKRAIVAFVDRVTKEGSPSFVPVAERIATFDNDGTLWGE